MNFFETKTIDFSALFFNKRKAKTFGDVLDLWLVNNKVRLKGGSVAKYQNLITQHIKPELGSVLMSNFNATLVNDFLETKSKKGRLDGKGGLSASYVRSIALIINATISFAVKENLCLPLKNTINKPTIPKQELKILSPFEQRKLEDFVLNNFNLQTAAIFISLRTGMRIGEVCGLAWNDVNLKTGVIHIRHTVARIKDGNKTKLVLDTPKTTASMRDIPISTDLMPLLIKLKNYSSTFVISNSDSFANPRTLEYTFHKTLEMCGIENIKFHALRHTFATRCIEAGVDVKSLSEMLGHSNVGITLNTYVHSSLEMKRNQLEKICTLCN